MKSIMDHQVDVGGSGRCWQLQRVSLKILFFGHVPNSPFPEDAVFRIVVVSLVASIVNRRALVDLIFFTRGAGD